MIASFLAGDIAGVTAAFLGVQAGRRQVRRELPPPSTRWASSAASRLGHRSRQGNASAPPGSSPMPSAGWPQLAGGTNVPLTRQSGGCRRPARDPGRRRRTDRKLFVQFGVNGRQRHHGSPAASFIIEVAFYDANPAVAGANLLSRVFVNPSAMQKCFSFVQTIKGVSAGTVYAVVNDSLVRHRSLFHRIPFIWKKTTPTTSMPMRMLRILFPCSHPILLFSGIRHSRLPSTPSL